MLIACGYCNKLAEKCTGEVNRAKKSSSPIYCNRICAGLGRRTNKTKEQKKLEKREYDKEYREKNFEARAVQKAAYHKLTYDPVKQREYNQRRMPFHIEYCRRPEYRESKKAYDRIYNAKRDYGEFWEHQLLILDIEKEALSKQSRYEIMLEKGVLNKSNKRKRAYEKLISAELENSPLGNLIRA